MTHHGRTLAAALAFSVLATACGGGGDDASPFAPATDTTGATPDETTPSSLADDTPPAVTEEVVTVGLSTEFGGFRYHVAEARLEERLGAPVVLVSIDVENLGPESARPPSILSLQTAERVIDRSGFGVTVDVDPGATENGTYDFPVGAGFTFEDAVVLIGREGGAQATVPLSGGTVVSLAPVETTIDQIGTAELVEIRLDRAVVDWHSLAFHGEASDEGTAYLTLIVDVTLGNRSRTANDTFELVLPSGTTVTPERAPNEVLEVDETAEGLEVAFIVPDPFVGDYRLRLLNLSRYPDDTVAEVPFELGT